MKTNFKLYVIAKTQNSYVEYIRFRLFKNEKLLYDQITDNSNKGELTLKYFHYITLLNKIDINKANNKKQPNILDFKISISDFISFTIENQSKSIEILKIDNNFKISDYFQSNNTDEIKNHLIIPIEVELSTLPS